MSPGRLALGGDLEFEFGTPPKEWEQLGLSFLAAGECTAAHAQAIRTGLQLIDCAPLLRRTFDDLVLRIRLLRSPAPGVDLSFSDPRVPFSICVSIPHELEFAAGCRVAEALVHEAMHLQLQLIDDSIPIATSTAQTYYSPWKHELRAPSGILHALFVFAAVDYWLRRLPASHREYAMRRIDEIGEQVRKVGHLETGVFSEAGIAVLTRTFAYFAKSHSKSISGH